ncbi:PucR family transcriptional regulator [Acidaminobacter sp.]|uniref:PucR family transcriptional regulator n=1 Tax=Acidaminobacter sp. TaxID=1872102 RepID=UPI00137F9104|nr:PucR family transcriptional regulator [Acidaminobacter sp.]MDK9711116.1 PucR family transcriptional regulator [Acidaminobacter sp.]MZQ97378.1 PucR family transcriptional regulator [Acidaminobacter sp.]
MSITVLEATKLSTFKNFKLIVGHSGLDRPVEKIGILDYEFISNIHGQFIPGEFVISSLLFAKDHPERILSAVTSLIEDGVSGLAIKNIYYNTLPREVLAYASEHSFPIFIFDNTVYFEDIITELTDKLRSVDNEALLEAKVDALVRLSLNKATVREIALEINTSFREHFFVLYLREKKLFNPQGSIKLLDEIKKQRSLELQNSVMRYRQGLLLIFTFDQSLEETKLKSTSLQVFSKLGIPSDQYEAGISGAHADLSDLGRAINESLYAQKTSALINERICAFSDIGLYSILMPYHQELWMRQFYDRILKPIKDYDERYNTQLFDTAQAFVQQDGKIAETAEALFMHSNTIRYRIGKIKSLLHMEAAEGSFYEQLSVAVKLDRIYSL